MPAVPSHSVGDVAFGPDGRLNMSAGEGANFNTLNLGDPGDSAHQCPSSCHVHPLQGFTGSSGAFTAPDHEYPAYLTLTLTATDRRGATATQTVRLDPRTVVLDVATDPPSLNVSLNAELVTAPAQRTVIAGSLNTVTAADQGPYRFTAWSDDGAAPVSCGRRRTPR